jgi:phage terminase large subunit-like protein
VIKEDARAEEFMKRLDDAADDWVFRARDAQLPPWCWLFLGGRDAGKSHSMSAAVHWRWRRGLHLAVDAPSLRRS